MTELKWWETSWAKLLPGDQVLAPDGTAWTVRASINYAGRGTYELSAPGRGTAWSEHADAEPVQARRPNLVEPESRILDRTSSVAEVIEAFAKVGIELSEVEG